MSDTKLKCPFCNETELEKGIELRNGGCMLGCPKCKLVAPNIFWQALIDTRKALDVLLLTINRLENQNYKDCAWHLRLAIAKIKAIGIANKALEQIESITKGGN